MPVAAPAALYSLEAMNATAEVSGAVISPDGRFVAYVVTRNVLERNASVDALHVYDLRRRADRTLAYAHQSYANLMWSKADALAYIADDPRGGADQIFTADARGGPERRVTSGATDVMDAAWSPDGSRFAFVRRDAVPKKTGAAAYEDAFEVGDNAYLATHAPVPAQLWVASLDGAERRLTSGSRSVRDDAPSWSSDGRFLAYAQSEGAAYGVRDRSAVERIDVATGRRTPLTGKTRYEESPLYSPVSDLVAYQYPYGGDPAGESDVWLVPAGGGDARDLSAPLDRHVEDFAWLDGTHVLLRAYDGTRARLVDAAVGGGFRDLPAGGVADASIETQCASNAGGIAFTGSTPDHPNELYYLAPGAKAPERLTHENDAIAALRLGKETEFVYRNGGFTQEAVLTYPPGYDPHKTYPLAIRVHGGPNLSSFVAFDPFYQYAASRGYVVLAPNYRGSTNGGNAFERAIFRDASVGPGSDVVAAVDAVEAAGIADPSRIGVSGWSYGGQLTTWLIGHYQIWKAAVTGAAVNDLVVDYSIADDIDDDRGAFGASPYAGGELAAWQAQSPMTFFQNIRTPTLILSNVYDVRVPIVENYELFHALRDRGVPVEFYAYPSTGHLPNGPVRLADAYRRWLDWFDRYLKP